MQTVSKLRLQRGWQFYRTVNGMELTSMIKKSRLRLGGGTIEQIETMINLLNNGIPLNTAAEDLSLHTGIQLTVVKRILKLLLARGALITAQDSSFDPDTLYDRQIRFFDNFETSENSGSIYNEKLQNRKVVVVGLGGYGTMLTLLLVRIGIKHIVGIDLDRVELSNLSRQVLYTRNDIGKLKVDACQDAITNFISVDDSVRFEGHALWIKAPEDLMPYLAGADLVISAFGYPPNISLENVALAAGRAGVPSLLLGGSWVGPLTVPGETACYWCLTSRSAIAQVIQASHARFAQTENNRPLGGVFAPRISICTSLAVWEAVRFLSGIDRPPTLDGLVTLDLFHYEKQLFVSVQRNPNCPVCGSWHRKIENTPT